MHYNLYTDVTPSVDGYKDMDEQIDECKKYSVSDIFCCGYAMYFWEGIKLCYPEYCRKQKSVEEISEKTEQSGCDGVFRVVSEQRYCCGQAFL